MKGVISILTDVTKDHGSIFLIICPEFFFLIVKVLKIDRCIISVENSKGLKAGTVQEEKQEFHFVSLRHFLPSCW